VHARPIWSRMGKVSVIVPIVVPGGRDGEGVLPLVLVKVHKGKLSCLMVVPTVTQTHVHPQHTAVWVVLRSHLRRVDEYPLA
jgi:hypothetical protein